MEYIVVAGICIFIVYQIASHNPVLSFIAATALASYWIYKLILNSKWLSNWDANSTAAASTRQEQTRVEEWQNFAMPSLEQFLTDTAIPATHPHAVHRVHSILATAYKMATFDPKLFTPARATALYQQFVQSTVRALYDYGKYLPQQLKQSGTSPFTYKYLPTSEDLEQANRALADHFFAYSEILPMAGPQLPPEPEFHVWDTEKVASERRDFERKLKEHQKRVAEILEAQTPEQKIFHETALYRFASSFAPEPEDVPLIIDPSKWFETTWVIASQGRGKSNLLRQLILHHLVDACVIIIDPKGDLIETFSKHAPIKDRLVILDPSPEHPLAINPLDIGHSTEFIKYIFELLNADMTTNHATIVYYVMLLCTKIEGASLATFREILETGWQKYSKEVEKLDPEDRTFFRLQWDDALYKPRRPEVLARLRAMTASEAMKPMMRCNKTLLDLEQLMDDKKVVLINNNYEKLEDAGAELLGRLIIGMVWAAARKRSLHHGKKTPVFLVIDEAHWVIANDTRIPTIIQQTRSQKIGLIVAHQELQSIKNPDVKAALFNAAIKFGNPRGEAAMLAEKFDTDAEFLRNQRKGTFAAWVADQTKEAVSINVPHLAGDDNALFNYPRLSEEEYQEILQRSRDKYCYRPGPRPDEPRPEQPKKKQKPFKKDRRAASSENVEDF